MLREQLPDLLHHKGRQYLLVLLIGHLAQLLDGDWLVRQPHLQVLSDGKHEEGGQRVGWVAKDVAGEGLRYVAPHREAERSLRGHLHWLSLVGSPGGSWRGVARHDFTWGGRY